MKTRSSNATRPSDATRPSMLDCLMDTERPWRCRIIKTRKDYDGKRFFKIHWKSTTIPAGNKWGVKKISWNDSWEPEENVAADRIRSFWRRRQFN